MSLDIELREYQSSACELDDTDARFLVKHFSNKIAVSQRPGETGYFLDPGPRVGIVELPSGRRVFCNPKVPVANLFFMLATAERFSSPFTDQPISFQRIDELFDFLVKHLTNLVYQRLAHGLYRSYVEREENLIAIRGRILIGEDIRRNHVLRHRTYCQFSEFTWDISENRIIRQTIFAVSRLARRHELRMRLRALDAALAEVDPTPLPLSAFDRFQYHRLNEDYRPIHRLCRLFLEGASVSEHLGTFGFKAFLLDMNLLYEQFVTESLRSRIGGEFSVDPQHESKLDVGNAVTIRPDLTINRNGLPVLVADCKYKRLKFGQYQHPDLYQLLAYCTAVGLTRGVLIYPRGEAELPAAVAVRNSPILIRHLQINLGDPLPHLQRSLDLLAHELIALAIPGMLAA